MIVLVGTLIAWRVLSGTTRIAIGPIQIGLQTLYTPFLILVLAVTLRAWLAWRPVLRLDDPGARLTVLLRLGLVSVGICLVLLLPQLVGIALRFVSGRLPGTEVYWRSSPRGVDALAYVVPNPNHAWFGDLTRPWFMPDQPLAFPEFVGSFSIVAFAVIATGAWLRLLPRFWVAFTGFFVVALTRAIHTHCRHQHLRDRAVGPVALRTSDRDGAVPLQVRGRGDAWSVLAGRVRPRGLRRRYAAPRWAGALLAGDARDRAAAGAAPTAFGGCPGCVSTHCATGDESGRLLELPTGIRDGTSSLGNFNASSAYFQTSHRRPLIGGYLSRVSRWRKAENERTPMLRALFALSEGRDLSLDQMDEARHSRDAFLRRSCVKFVVVNKHRASNDLQAFAVEALGLTRVHEDAAYVLFTPVDPPACEPVLSSSRGRLSSFSWWRKPSE